MTTLQRKRLEIAVTPEKNRHVNWFETTIFVGAQEQRVTVALLVDPLQPKGWTMVDEVIRRLRRECQKQSTATMALRLQSALERANELVYRDSRALGGISVVMAAFTESDSQVVTVELAHCGNCRAYFLAGDLNEGNVDRRYRLPSNRNRLVELTNVQRWGEQNVARGLLTEAQKAQYPQWDLPLAYLGAGAQVQAVPALNIPVARKADNAGTFYLQEKDQLVLVTNGLAQPNLQLKVSQAQPNTAAKLAKTIAQPATQRATSEGAAIAIQSRQHTDIDWYMVAYHSLIGSLRTFRWLIVLGLLAAILYTSWQWIGPLLAPAVAGSPISLENKATLIERLPVNGVQWDFDWTARRFTSAASAPALAIAALEPTERATIIAIQPAFATLATLTPAPPPPTATPATTVTTPNPAILANSLPRAAETPALTSRLPISPTQAPPPTAIPTPVVIKAVTTLTPTSTPTPTRTNTPLPLPTVTATATMTATAALAATGNPTVTVEIAVPQILERTDNLVEQGNQLTFHWLWPGQLQENQVFSIQIKKREDSDFREIKRLFSNDVQSQRGQFSQAVRINEEPGNYQWRIVIIDNAQIFQPSDPRNFDVTISNESGNGLDGEIDN